MLLCSQPSPKIYNKYERKKENLPSLFVILQKMKVMRTIEIRQELHQIIDKINDKRLLGAVHTLLTSSSKIVTHSSKGEPLTKGAMDEMLEASEAAISEGRVTDQQDLKNEMKNWRKK